MGILLCDETHKTHINMRQLKGKVKENAREKKERKKEFAENKEKVFTVALPVLGALFFLMIVYVYVKSRPKINLE